MTPTRWQLTLLPEAAWLVRSSQQGKWRGFMPEAKLISRYVVPRIVLASLDCGRVVGACQGRLLLLRVITIAALFEVFPGKVHLFRFLTH
jgi:hypothetical protein